MRESKKKSGHCFYNKYIYNTRQRANNEYLAFKEHKIVINDEKESFPKATILAIHIWGSLKFEGRAKNMEEGFASLPFKEIFEKVFSHAYKTGTKNWVLFAAQCLNIQLF